MLFTINFMFHFCVTQNKQYYRHLCAFTITLLVYWVGELKRC